MRQTCRTLTLIRNKTKKAFDAVKKGGHHNGGGKKDKEKNGGGKKQKMYARYTVVTNGKTATKNQPTPRTGIRTRTADARPEDTSTITLVGQDATGPLLDHPLHVRARHLHSASTAEVTTNQI